MSNPMDITNLVSVAAGLLVLGACVLFWIRAKSAWTLLALAGQAVSVACRLLLFIPDVFVQFPPLRFVWPVGALVFAIGLAGHAWVEYEAAQQSAKP